MSFDSSSSALSTDIKWNEICLEILKRTRQIVQMRMAGNDFDCFDDEPVDQVIDLLEFTAVEMSVDPQISTARDPVTPDLFLGFWLVGHLVRDAPMSNGWLIGTSLHVDVNFLLFYTSSRVAFFKVLIRITFRFFHDHRERDRWPIQSKKATKNFFWKITPETRFKVEWSGRCSTVFEWTGSFA